MSLTRRACLRPGCSCKGFKVRVSFPGSSVLARSAGRPPSFTAEARLAGPYAKEIRSLFRKAVMVN